MEPWHWGMMFNAGESVVFVGIAAVFGYHVWSGLRTRIVSFPLNVLVFQQFERDKSPENFWGVMAVNIVGVAVALSAAGYLGWSALGLSARQVERLEALNGCYEGQGTPDFLRPPGHWAFRVANGVIFDRTGKAVSTIRLLGTKSAKTFVSFSPGILISDDEHKAMTVYQGNTVAGEAYLTGSRANLALKNDWGDLMQTTSCL